jgi:hemoglobin-like flavoprotein
LADLCSSISVPSGGTAVSVLTIKSNEFLREQKYGKHSKFVSVTLPILSRKGKKKTNTLFMRNFRQHNSSTDTNNGTGIKPTKVDKIEILCRIGEGLQDRESEDRNMDCKILPILQIHVYLYIYAYKTT